MQRKTQFRNNGVIWHINFPSGPTGYDILEYKANKRFALLVKRSFDVTMSVLVIAFVLVWLLPVLAILIKLDSRGPVFFVQKRVGAHGKKFNCLKLRSMVVNQLAHIKQAEKDDWRITPFGKFMRTTFLDELPQFVNVLWGEMSIVGPRPHMVKDCDDFIKMVPIYEQRSMVRPGITGMAQVKGCKGVVNGFHDVSHRFKWDMFYIRNTSFLLDCQILYKTIFPTKFLESKNKRTNRIIMKRFHLANNGRINKF